MKQPTVAAALVVTALTLGPAVATASSASAAPASDASWGHAGSGDHHLKQGCHTYSFRYRVTPPAGDWMAEIKLLNPRGRAVANKTFTSDADQPSGTASWQVCSTSTSPGVQQIRMLVTSYDGYERATARRVPTSTFRFTGGH